MTSELPEILIDITLWLEQDCDPPSCLRELDLFLDQTWPHLKLSSNKRRLTKTLALKQALAALLELRVIRASWSMPLLPRLRPVQPATPKKSKWIAIPW